MSYIRSIMRQVIIPFALAQVLNLAPAAAQDIDVDVKIKCRSCTLIAGGNNGTVDVRDSLAYSVHLEPGDFRMILTSSDVLHPVNMTITAVVRAGDYSFTTFVMDDQMASLPIINGTTIPKPKKD